MVGLLKWMLSSRENQQLYKKKFLVGWSVNWCRNYEKQYRGSFKKLQIELLYDPAIPLLGIYLEKTITGETYVQQYS